MISIGKNFDLDGTIFSGQCFRMDKTNKIYTLIISDRVLKINENEKTYDITSNNEKKLKKVVEEYFDLNRNYDYINNQIIKNDKTIKDIIDYNLRILQQDKFEMFISYIISQNNNIKKISYSINKLCENLGEEIIFEDTKYYLFPTQEKMLNINIEDLKECKLGFRDKYIMNALEKLKQDNKYLQKLEILSTDEAMKELMTIKGIGPKVASCILMFGFNRFDAYPIDTWAKKYLSEKLNTDNLAEQHKILKEKYGEYVGLAIQYMFNYERNIKVNK